MSLFPMERLVEMVKESVGERRGFEEVVAEFVEGELCSPEEAEQLRGLFVLPAKPSSIDDKFATFVEEAPSVSETSPLPTLDVSATTAAVSAPSHQLERAALDLHIDWGMELKPGVNLLPKFTIRGGSLKGAPHVYFPIDSRIPQKDWKFLPPLTRTADGWSFDQPFRLEEGGHYKIRIVVIDPTPGFTNPAYYHADFRIEVADPKDTDKRRKVKIQAFGCQFGSLRKKRRYRNRRRQRDPHGTGRVAGRSE